MLAALVRFEVRVIHPVSMWSSSPALPSATGMVGARRQNPSSETAKRDHDPTAAQSNARFQYKGYFQMLPIGPEPTVGLAEGFFDVAMAIDPKPRTVALIGADAEYS